MTVTEVVPVAREDQGERQAEVHIAMRPDFTHAYCGIPRGSLPLRLHMAKQDATCVLCLDLAGLS